MRCNYLGCFCVHSVPFVHRVLARTHPILTTGVTAHGTHGHEIGLGRLLMVMLSVSRRHRADRTATDIDFYDA
jgi:hypothetical protein